MTHVYLPVSCKCKLSSVVEHCVASYTVCQTDSDLVVLASHIFSRILTVGNLWIGQAQTRRGQEGVYKISFLTTYVGSCVKLQADSVTFGEEIRVQPLFVSGCCSVYFLGDVVRCCAILSDWCCVGHNVWSFIITSYTVDLKFVVLNIVILKLLCWHIHTYIFMFVHQEASSRLCCILVLLSPRCLMQSYTAFSSCVTLYFSFMSTSALLFGFTDSGSWVTTA